MPPLLQSLFARYRSLSWGGRFYALAVVISLFVLGSAAINDQRIRSYERMHRRIAEAGARSTRSVTVVDDTEEAYFLAIMGDFSGVALTGVVGRGPECSIDTTLLKDLRRFPEVTSLRLSQVPLKSADYQQIFALENLTRLNLALTDLTDADLEGVEKLDSLDTLELQYTPLTDASIPRLARLSGLSKLDITGTDITLEGAERLRKEYANLQGAQAAQVIHRPASSPRYRAAVIRLLPTNSYGIDTRGGGNRMRLQLREEPWKGHEQDIPLLAELKDVESVSVLGMPLSPALLDALVTLPNLQHLTISDTSTAGKDLARFAACRNLRSLRLANLRLDADFVGSLAPLESLETLTILNCKMDTGACQKVADVPGIHSLYLRQVVAPPTEFARLLAELERAEHLRLLELAAVPIDNDSIPRLARLTQLISLGIGSKDIDDDAIPTLSTFTHLQQLDINNTNISMPGSQNPPEGAFQLETALAPAEVRVVHPKSRLTTFTMNLSELTELAKVKAADKAKAASSASSGKVAP